MSDDIDAYLEVLAKGPEKTASTIRSKPLCEHCGMDYSAAKGLCNACYRYEQRHSGAKRPYELIDAEATRRWRQMGS